MRRNRLVLSLGSLLLVGGAGCGGGDETANPPDASLVDAGDLIDAGETDATPPDAAPTDVTARAIVDGAPVANVTIVFHDVDGSVISIKLTGDDGTAIETMPGGGMVTAVAPPDGVFGAPAGQTAMFTFAGVEPGDELVFGDAAIPTPDDIVATVEVGMAEAHPTAASYAVDIGCGSGTLFLPTNTLERDVRQSCVGGDGAVDALGIARNGLGESVAFSFAKNVAIADEGKTAVTLPAWDAPFSAFSLTLSGAPATAIGARLRQTLIVDGQQFGASTVEAGFIGGALSVQRNVPTGFADYIDVNGTVVLDGTDARLILASRQVPAPTRTIDVSTALPPIAGAVLSTADASRPTITYAANGDLSVADGGLAAFAWTQPGDEIEHRWIVMIAPGNNTAQVPALPDELASLRPTDESTYLSTGVAFFEADFVEDYRDLRHNIGFELIDEIPTPAGAFAMSATVSEDFDL